VTVLAGLIIGFCAGAVTVLALGLCASSAESDFWREYALDRDEGRDGDGQGTGGHR
jgi:hypothetical protein